MTDRQWKRLVRGIQQQRCILLLGPQLGGILQDDRWEPMVESFATYLTEELATESISFDESACCKLPYIAQLFLGIEGMKRIDLEDEARDYYRVHAKEIPPVYKVLANLPFHLVIDTTFDNYMVRAFNNVGKLCQPAFYNFKRQAPFTVSLDSINAQHPLVYQLFGSLEKPESLVITAEDQIEFVRNVVKGDPGIPTEVLEQFDQSKSYLFLGFDLEDWELSLMLESLNLKEGTATHRPMMERYPATQATRMLFEKRYKFHFIEKNGLDFVTELDEKVDEQSEEQSKDRKPQRKIFIAFADNDVFYAQQLYNFLEPLVDNGEVEVFSKINITAGLEMDLVIDKYLEMADVLLLLLSADFLADPDIKEKELKRAMERHHENDATVIPIIARACDWQSNAELAALAPLPVNGVPITSRTWATPDDAFLHIVKYLKRRLW